MHTLRAARLQQDYAAPLPGAISGFEARRGYSEAPSAADETAAIRTLMPLVKRIAMHLRGRLPDAVQLDDLIQAGLIAVLRIFRRSGLAALNEAALRRTIINAMIDEARREAWAPVRAVRVAKRAAVAMAAVRRRLGRDGSDEDVAAEMGVPVAEYQRCLLDIAGLRLLRLDAFDESTEEGLQVVGSQEAALHQRRTAATLAAAIAELPEREKLVISLYYEQELNMEEVGRVLELDKSTVCRAHGRALLMLRNALVADGAGRPASRRATGS